MDPGGWKRSKWPLTIAVALLGIIGALRPPGSFWAASGAQSGRSGIVTEMDDQEVARWARFFAPADPVTAVAVALAEHGGSVDPSATNRNSDGSTDSGIWQINSVHQRSHPAWTVEALKNPQTNAEAMGVLSRGGASFSAWTGTYTKGLHRPYMERARAANDAVQDNPLSERLGDIADPSNLNPANVIDNVAGAIGSLTEAVAGFVTFVTDPDTWRRAAIVALGAAVVVIGVSVVARGTEVGQTVEKAATSAIGKGR